MSRRWKGEVIKVSNPRFEHGSAEHELYKEQQKRYYADTADEQRARARNRVARKRERNQQWVVNFLHGKVCEHCGLSDTRVLAFDHLDGFEKFANIADLVSRGLALQKLKDEVTKCRVLCHNCHMLHTFEQMGGTYHTKIKPCTDAEFEEKYGDFLS